MENGSGTDSDGEIYNYWIRWFLNAKGNEYFCEIDEEYILDRFNLTGLQSQVPFYQQAIELMTDELDENNYSEEQFNEFFSSAKHLYGLIHARFIITARGIMKMVEKYKRCDFGRCPRVYCNQHPLLPIGVTDEVGEMPVRLYCCKCEDIYIPKSSKHNTIDGAYFGASFPHMLLQMYPAIKTQISEPMQRYVPKIFGFKVHKIANLHRWQDKQRELMNIRINEPTS
ncbi:hypothetical protein BB559_001334 [Furculomyces boomerangus]|uniref:Casein kinase II subunit beta n=2 Tax=Harpellales TaxID=61421 RepID=A0A2T9Z2A7_9FUNG|nr:hypothetical protein BB559_001334 [Furculomyces boomerangus]PVZ99037.1 hypothetical protein BB558_004956 [Smittium angustum]